MRERTWMRPNYLPLAENGKAVQIVLYYACFHAASALLLSRGFSSSKHTGVRSLLNEHFRKTGKLAAEHARTYNTLFELRLDADYADAFKLSAEEVHPLISSTEEFIDAVVRLINDRH